MNIGYIGSGPISNFHIPALRETGFKIKAIGSQAASENCKNFASKYNLDHEFCNDGWEEVLEKNVDAFCICIDTSFTPQILKKALDKNKPIFVEKPVSWKLNQLNEIVNHQNSESIFVGYNRRFYETVNKLKQNCDQSEGGTILANIPDSKPGIRQFINNASHIIDNLRFITGEFEIINKTIRFNATKDDIDSISALGRNEKWDFLINAHSQIPANFCISVNSSKDIFELKPIEKYSHFSGLEICEPTREFPIRQYLPKLQTSFLEDNTFKPGFINMYKSFQVFIDKGVSKNSVSIHEAKKTLIKCWDLLECDIAENFSNYEKRRSYSS